MSFKEHQDEVHKWVSQFEKPYWEPLEILARITEETGELAREINDRYGAKKKKPTEDKKEIEDEIGDIFFALICLANREGINLDDTFKKTMDKCYDRDNNRFTKK